MMPYVANLARGEILDCDRFSRALNPQVET